MYTVYELRNEETGRRYFGSTNRTLSERWANTHGYFYNYALDRDIHRYDFKYVVLKKFEEETEARLFERKMIIEHWDENLYNLSIRTFNKVARDKYVWEAYDLDKRLYYYGTTRDSLENFQNNLPTEHGHIIYSGCGSSIEEERMWGDLFAKPTSTRGYRDCLKALQRNLTINSSGFSLEKFETFVNKKDKSPEEKEKMEFYLLEFMKIIEEAKDRGLLLDYDPLVKIG